MEFNEKLQELRKRKNLTQEELAEQLYVSRTAISKWESGRGLPNVESLKAISKFFSISLDDLLSGEELLVIAEDEYKQKNTKLQDLMQGMIDVSAILLLFVPCFGQTISGAVQAVSLLALHELPQWLITTYFIVIIGMVLVGILSLALQNISTALWHKHQRNLSLLLNISAVFLFIVSRQAYAAALTFTLLIMKSILLIKQR